MQNAYYKTCNIQKVRIIFTLEFQCETVNNVLSNNEMESQLLN